MSQSDQHTIDTAEAVIPTYCKAPNPARIGASSQSVNDLSVSKGGEPGATVGGAVFGGKTVREVLADLGGLLNTTCAPTLGSRISQVLSAG